MSNNTLQALKQNNDSIFKVDDTGAVTRIFSNTVVAACIGAGTIMLFNGTASNEDRIICDGKDRSESDEWDDIAKDSLTSAELDEVAAYLKKTGQASM